MGVLFFFVLGLTDLDGCPVLFLFFFAITLSFHAINANIAESSNAIMSTKRYLLTQLVWTASIFLIAEQFMIENKDERYGFHIFAPFLMLLTIESPS